jgi:hypothetical protein
LSLCILCTHKSQLFLPEQMARDAWLLNLQAFPNRFEVLNGIMLSENVKKNMENEIVVAHCTKADLAYSAYHVNKF